MLERTRGSFYSQLPERSARVMHLSVCMSVRVRNSKTIAPIDLIFYTRSITAMAQSSSKKTWIRIRIWTQECIFKDSSPLVDRTKYAIKVLLGKHVLWGNERGSLISDCLVPIRKHPSRVLCIKDGGQWDVFNDESRFSRLSVTQMKYKVVYIPDGRDLFPTAKTNVLFPQIDQITRLNAYF